MGLTSILFGTQRNLPKGVYPGIAIVAFFIAVDIFKTQIKYSRFYDIPDTSRFLNEPRDNQKIPLTATGDPFRIRNSDFCEQNPRLQYIVVVSSATKHFIRRNVIRNTWGLFGHSENKPFDVVFLLGEPRYEKEQLTIQEENMKFGDIVQGRFLDTYHNLTQKSVLGFRWVSQYCRNVKNVVKVDDDVFLNIFRLPNVLRNLDIQNTKIKCLYLKSGRIHRHWKYKTQAFPGLTYYPFGYCAGFAVVISRDFVLELFEASKKTPFFWLEDVYYSGILAQEIGNVTYEYFNNLARWSKEGLSCYHRQNPCTLVAAKFDDTESMEYAWNLIIRDLPISVPFVNWRLLQDRSLTISSKHIRFYLQLKSLPWCTLLSMYSFIIYLYVYKRYKDNHY